MFKLQAVVLSSQGLVHYGPTLLTADQLAEKDYALEMTRFLDLSWTQEFVEFIFDGYLASKAKVVI